MLNKPKRRQYPSHHNLTAPVNYKLNSGLIKSNTGLIACESGILTAAQLAAVVMCMKRKVKKVFPFLLRVFPHLPVTKRAIELTLGKGKASISYWATPIKAGTIILEINGDKRILIRAALKAASRKLPIRTQIIQSLFP